MLAPGEHTFGLVDISPLERHGRGHMHAARKHVDSALEVDLLVDTKIIGVFQTQTVGLHLRGSHRGEYLAPCAARVRGRDEER